MEILSPRLAWKAPDAHRRLPGIVYTSASNAPITKFTFSIAWGQQPSTAVVDFAWDAPLGPGAIAHISLGNFHFWGICKSYMHNTSTGGSLATCQFVDMREYLNHDVVFGCFNMTHTRFVDGKRVKRYMHILPVDYPAHKRTYTDVPMTCSQIIAAMLCSPTTFTDWGINYCDSVTGVKTTGYHPTLLNYPSYGIDCMQGTKLGTALQQVLDQHGMVLGINHEYFEASAYGLVFTRKGEGPVPSFPSGSNNRKDGKTLSEVPTRVRVIGGRNLYQVHNLKFDGVRGAEGNDLEPDWMPAWEQFWADTSLFAQWVFENLSVETDIKDKYGVVTIAKGTRYNAIPGDQEDYIGHQLAMARASKMTVSEFADIRDQPAWMDGDSFRDWRRFAGRCRMDLPVFVYTENLVYRAYKLSPNFTMTNAFGVTVTRDCIDISNQMLARVEYDPGNGEMTWRIDKAAHGCGFACAQGFMVGEEIFKTMSPDRFDLDDFTASQNVWAPQEFQIDDSGEVDGNYLLFRNPIIRTDSFFTKGSSQAEITEFNNFAALDITAPIEIPKLRVALCLECEQFLWSYPHDGNGMRDECISISELCREMTGTKDGGFSEVPYADGKTAGQKADEVATNYLARQAIYRLGGYDRAVGLTSTPTAMHGSIDRVTVNLDAQSGFHETVDFTGERTFLAFHGERDFERLQHLNTTVPGQEDLRARARALEVDAVAMKRDPKTLKAMVDQWHKGETQVQPIAP